MTVPQPTLPQTPPTVAGKYRLEERLGEGALGTVHRAVHLGIEKAFAVKLLKTAGSSTPAALARFRIEAVALGRLRHPHIVEVTDSGIDDSTGVPYLVMELLAGTPLSELCRAQGPLPLARALPILEEIADAIDAAHGAGILHRDLKPGNVLVCAAGAKVLDFGLAELEGHEPPSLGSQESSPGLTSTGALPGTPLYVAPELIRHGEASPASDIYSFAVIAYELLGGRPPFQGTVAAVSSTPKGKFLGTKCFDALTAAALGPRRVSDMFGLVNLDEDRDGVIRRGRLAFRDTSGAERLSWAARAARELGVDPGTPREYWIDTRIDWSRYAHISWREVPAALDRNPDLFRGRLVLVGGDFHGSGDDYNHIPQRLGRNVVSGLTLQALMVDTIAAGQPIREAGRTPVLAVAALGVFLATAGALCARRAGAVWIALGSVLYLAFTFPVFWWTGLMLPVIAPLLLVLLGYVAALGLRRRLPSPPEVSTS